MIVKWNKERMKVIPKRAKGVQLDQELKKRMTPHNNVILYPGVNHVEDADWEAARIVCSYAIDRDIEAGHIVEIGKKVKKEAEVMNEKGEKEKVEVEKTEPVPINKITPGKAKKLIEATNDPATIAQWLKEEKRDEIRARLKDRQSEIDEFLENPEEDEEGSDEDSDEYVVED